MKLLLRQPRGLLTRSLAPGRRVYGERLVQLDGAEWRTWSPRRSKLSAFIANHGRFPDPHPKEWWLYLGAASGTTVSHVSDLLPEGRVLAVEFSPRPFRDLIGVAAARQNLLPVLADAGHPEAYEAFLERRVDVIYQDIAQRDQDRIFMKNAERFLRKGGTGFLAVKARSVNVALAPSEIYKRVASNLEAAGWKVQATTRLDPWQKDHAMLIVRRA